MADRLAGKKILVTGAANGIGHAVTNRFTDEGGEVIAVDLSADGLGRVRARTTHVADVSNDDAVSSLARKVGPVDVLFNAAGYVHIGNIFQTSDSDWSRSFDVNVRGTHLMMKAFLPGMIEQDRGVITNVASIGGSISAVADRYVYGATKAAVIALTKSVALDFVDRNIRANCICPGTVLTPSMRDRIEAVALRDGKDQSEIVSQYANRSPMRRMGEPEEIAGLAVFLCSDESSFCTGCSYIIDGGNSM